MPLQRLIQTLYPPQCVLCDERTDVDFALCGACWADTPFVTGLCCDSCGASLPGSDSTSDGILCDDCLRIARPWRKGRAVFEYRDSARNLILSLKHGDRTELARAAGPWMARAAEPFLQPGALVVPIPLHWSRLLRRTFNQAALLAQSMARTAGLDVLPDGLVRVRRTAPLKGHSSDDRFLEVQNAFASHPRRGAALAGRSIILVDDVMTSGATFAAATEACNKAGAADVCIVTLARVAKDA